MMDLLYGITQRFLQEGLPPDEQRKRSFIVLFQFLLFPVLTFFVFTKVRDHGFTMEVAMIAAGAGLSIVMLVSIRYVANLLLFFRLGSAYIVLLAIYEVAIGGGEGAAILWFYFHPLTSLFIFGRKEGPWWIAIGLLCIMGIMLFDLGTYPYSTAMALRFGASYLVLSLLSYGLEESRDRYYTALATEKLALEHALEQVQTLQKLMPICASCKKIRDDSGYWHDVERYMGEHVEVQFSHSTCPNCTPRPVSTVTFQEAN